MIKLSLLKELIIKVKYDSILIITCRLTKYGYFILYIKVLTAEDLAYIFLKIIINNHRLLEKIISDKNKFFTSNFWKSLTDQFRINYKFLIIYHPQINEQTERLNQTMK